MRLILIVAFDNVSLARLAPAKLAKMALVHKPIERYSRLREDLARFCVDNLDIVDVTIVSLEKKNATPRNGYRKNRIICEFAVPHYLHQLFSLKPPRVCSVGHVWVDSCLDNSPKTISTNQIKLKCLPNCWEVNGRFSIC